MLQFVEELWKPADLFPTLSALIRFILGMIEFYFIDAKVFGFIARAKSLL